MKTSHSLMYPKICPFPPEGVTGIKMVGFASLWKVIKYILKNKEARAAVMAGRYRLLKIVPDKITRPEQ